MKKNKEVSAIKQFQKNLRIGLNNYYHEAHSDSIKRGLAKKRLSTSSNLPCKAV